MNSTLNTAADPMGAAIYDYHKTGEADTLIVHSSMFEDDEIPVADLYKKMYKIASDLKHIKGNKVTIDNLHMNGYGNQMMAEGVLETLGVPAAKIQEYKKDWRKLPSMAPILNHAHGPRYLISIEEYEVLKKAADAKKMTVEAFVWSILKEELKKVK